MLFLSVLEFLQHTTFYSKFHKQFVSFYDPLSFSLLKVDYICLKYLISATYTVLPRQVCQAFYHSLLQMLKSREILYFISWKNTYASFVFNGKLVNQIVSLFVPIARGLKPIFTIQ